MAMVFVYGTLKRGGCRARVLGGQRLVGGARTVPRYRLYDCGAYPALVEAPTGGRAIEGELWDVDAACLAVLDEIEGVAEGLYRRAPVRLAPPFDGEVVDTYLYLGSVVGLVECGSRWEERAG